MGKNFLPNIVFYSFLSFYGDDYNELLQQAVAVIETSRLRIAKQLNTIAMSSFGEIGKLLNESKPIGVAE